jgi:hypothetical protein
MLTSISRSTPGIFFTSARIFSESTPRSMSEARNMSPLTPIGQSR